ncbi:MAG: VWA domain-containing protein [Candidatus Kapabacteria bacterium]|nr:VWA domain-containing protein [Candidatus Kapabacteria bacterium]
MESLSLDLAGGPWYVYVAFALIAIAVSTFFYRVTNPPLDRRMRSTLIVLRSIGLMALILLLYEPLARFRRSETIQPRVAVAVDVSRSMNMRDRSRDRQADVRSVVKQVSDRLGDAADVYVFDETLRNLSGSIDTMRMAGFRSDIGAAIRKLANAGADADYGAVLLISDGNHNSGEQPLYAAERSGVAVYSLGIGDSIPPADLRMVALTSSGVGVVNEQMPITIDVEQTYISDRSAAVVINDNGTDVVRLPLELRQSVPRYQLTYQWTPSSEGMHLVTARIVDAGSEFTQMNNTAQTTIRVRKNKKRVVLFAGAPSPDVSFIRTSIAQDPSLELGTFIHREGPSFYEGAPSVAALADATSIVLIGFPTAFTPKSVIDDIASRCRRGASLLFVASVSTDYGKLGALAEFLPFRVTSNRPIEISVAADVSTVATADPLMRLSGGEQDAETWNSLPPIYRTELFVEPTAGATVLARLKIGSTPIDEPLIIKRDIGQSRSLAVLGHGLYRWKLLGQGPAQARGSAVSDVLQTFTGNTMKWLAVRDDERRVQIRSTHETYVVGETVAFTASVFDQTFSAVDDAEVRLVLDGAGAQRTVELSPKGAGQYGASIGSLPPGRYSFSGMASVRGVALGRDQGTFTVSQIGLEEQTTAMNASLLRVLSQRTGARFSGIDSVDALLDAMMNDPRLRPIVRTSERELALHHLPWIIAVAIAAFATEWFLRKRRGLV